jgi:hypothetical protein
MRWELVRGRATRPALLALGRGSGGVQAGQGGGGGSGGWAAGPEREIEWSTYCCVIDLLGPAFPRTLASPLRGFSHGEVSGTRPVAGSQKWACGRNKALLTPSPALDDDASRLAEVHPFNRVTRAHARGQTSSAPRGRARTRSPASRPVVPPPPLSAAARQVSLRRTRPTPRRARRHGRWRSGRSVSQATQRRRRWRQAQRRRRRWCSCHASQQSGASDRGGCGARGGAAG